MINHLLNGMILQVLLSGLSPSAAVKIHLLRLFFRKVGPEVICRNGVVPSGHYKWPYKWATGGYCTLTSGVYGPPSYNWIRGPPCMILSLHLQNKSFKRKKNKVDVKFCCLLWGVHSVLIKRASLRPGIPRQSKVPDKKHKHNSNTKSKKLQNNSNKNLPNFQNII